MSSAIAANAPPKSRLPLNSRMARFTSRIIFSRCSLRSSGDRSSPMISMLVIRPIGNPFGKGPTRIDEPSPPMNGNRRRDRRTSGRSGDVALRHLEIAVDGDAVDDPDTGTFLPGEQRVLAPPLGPEHLFDRPLE